VLREPASILANEAAQDREEVRHGLASTGVAELDHAERDARLGYFARLTQQSGKAPATQTTRPPQPHDDRHRGLDVVVAESLRGRARLLFDVDQEARAALVLAAAHRSTSSPSNSTSRMG
jgi:hypothetical protein